MSEGNSSAASDAETFRAYQRGTRNAGFVACLIGAMVMIAGRFVPGLPVWLATSFPVIRLAPPGSVGEVATK